jgi:AraC-like DNA-binding protein
MTGTRTTVVAHQSELGSWVLAQREPPAALRPYMALYSGYRETERRFDHHLQAASTRIPLILNLGPPYRIDGPLSRNQTRRSFVAGVHDGPTLVGADGRQHCLQVDLTPLGASRILGVPMHVLKNEVIEIDDLLGKRFSALLVEQLHDTPDWEARFALLEAFLSARIQRAPAIPPGIVDAWLRLDLSEGDLRIGNLASELGWSSRHLIAQFREYIGVPPKLLARIRRFERASKLLDGEASVCLASVAQAAGYFDQAHLHRDVRQFAGVTPAMFLRRRVAGMDGLVGE